MNTPQLEKTAAKPFTEAEFLPAVKELVCIWIYLESLEQGGDGMPAWLTHYFKLGIFASDYLLSLPPAQDVLDSHALCLDLTTLHSSVGYSIARRVGFGMHARSLGPAFVPLVVSTRSVRQKILWESLTLPVT